MPIPAIISDTNCLVFLSKIGRLELLPTLFGEILLTPAVAAEYGLPLPAWVIVQLGGLLPSPEQIPKRSGVGERSAIGLAPGLDGCLLTMDDEQPKQLVKALGISCLSTLGVLQLAKEAGLIDQLCPIVEQLRTVGSMWLAERVCRAAGE